MKIYIVLGKEVIFIFEFVFLDMKFLVFFNGEFNNVVKYFFSFVNVLKEDCVILNSKFGLISDCKWKLWLYIVRLNIVK